MYLKKVLVINPQNQLAIKGLEALSLQLPQSKNKSFSVTMKYISIILGIFVCIIVIFLLVENLVSRKVSLDSSGRVIAHELNVKGDKVVYALCTKPIVIKITTTRGKVLNEFHLQKDCIQRDRIIETSPSLYNELLIGGDLFVSKDNVFYLYLRFRTNFDLIVFNETAILDRNAFPKLDLYQGVPKLDLYQGEGKLLKVEIPWAQIAYLQPQGTDFTITSWCPSCNSSFNFYKQYIVDGVMFTSKPISPHSKRYVASNNDIVIMLDSGQGTGNLIVLKPKS
jgi:hypothetical protein